MSAKAEDMIALTPLLGNYAFRLCRNRADADDLVQSALLRAWRAREKFSGEHPEQLMAWLKRILFNVYIEPWSHPKLVRAVQMPPQFANEPYPCAGEDSCEVAELYDALTRLTPEHQAALLLSRAGYGYDEIAESAGIPIGTVKSRVNRAETALRRALLEGRHRPRLRPRHEQRVYAAAPALDGLADA